MANFSDKKNSNALRGSATDLAAMLELTFQRVYDLVAKNVLHKEADGDFILPKAIREYYYHKFCSKEQIDYNKEKALHEQVKRQLAEIELAKRRNEVHEGADVELVMTDMLSNLRTQLLGIPVKMASQLAGKTREEIADLLKNEIEDRLTELSDYSPTMFDENSISEEDAKKKQ